jgi:hypothetical protein
VSLDAGAIVRSEVVSNLESLRYVHRVDATVVDAAPLN